MIRLLSKRPLQKLSATGSYGSELEGHRIGLSEPERSNNFHSGSGRPSWLRRLILPAVLALFLTFDVLGQEINADTLGTLVPEPVLPAFDQSPPDTTVNPIGPGYFEFGASAGLTRYYSDAPRKTPYPELVHLLASQGGSFLFDLATPGWGHGLSVFRADPTDVGLSYGGLLLDDLFYGKPRFDFVPIASVDTVSLRPVSFGNAQSFQLSARPYSSARPLTDALYWTSNAGLQKVTVTHSQARTRRIAGKPGTLRLLAGYSGAAADGEYPSSKLTRGRQMQARLRYEQERWSFELMELYNRGSVAQHGGVNPPIYRRLEASVQNSGAARQTRRNDLSARVRVRAFSDEPISAVLFYSRQTDVFIDPTQLVDTVSTKARRIGLHLEQNITLGKGSIALFGSGWSDGIRSASWLSDSLTLGTNFVSTGMRLGYVGALNVDSEIAFLSSGNNNGLSVAATVSKTANNLEVYAAGGFAPRRQTLFDRNGYADVSDGTLFAGLSDPNEPQSSVANARVGAALDANTSRFTLTAFANFRNANEAVLATDVTGDSLKWLRSEALTTFGITGTIGLRTKSQKGFYGFVAPTFVPWTNVSSASALSQVQSQPELIIRAVLGARYTLFEGDLVANAYVRGSYWSSFGGRRLHLPTGLLVLPDAAAELLPASGTVDLVLEAGIRTATIFVALENFLASTTLLEGNQLVSGYPLAAQRFRLGVFWPIFD